MSSRELATCAGCGCVCDDVELLVGDGGAVEDVSGTCPLGDAWLAERLAPAPPLARVDGRAVPLDDALRAAAAILRAARAPLVCGLGQATCEAQRVAVAIADALGAAIDPAGGSPAALAYEDIGASTATLGEIRDRADVVVVWRADPVATHPRLLERLEIDRPGRTLVVVDEPPPAAAGGGASGAGGGVSRASARPGGVSRAAGAAATPGAVPHAVRSDTAALAGTLVELPPRRSVDALWLLRALVRDVPASADGLPLDALAQLARRLRGAHVAILHAASDHLEALGIHALVRELSREAHAVSLALAREANAVGARDVLAWQTGFAAAVSLASGHPVAEPYALSAAGLLARGEVDAALVVGGELADSGAIPLVSVDPRPTATAAVARVALAPAAAGVRHAGVVHRLDGVPVPLRALLPADRPGDAELLQALLAEVRA